MRHCAVILDICENTHKQVISIRGKEVKDKVVSLSLIKAQLAMTLLLMLNHCYSKIYT